MAYLFKLLFGWAVPWLAPVLAIVKPMVEAVFDVVGVVTSRLKSIRVATNGLVVACLLVASAFGGWYLVRWGKSLERERQAAADRAAVARANSDIDAVIAYRRGEIAADDARLRAVSAELRAAIERIPADTVEVAGPARVERIAVPVPVVTPGPVRVVRGVCDLPEDVAAAVNKVNVGANRK